MLTEAELDSMRSAAAEALPGTAVIQRETFTSDSGGGGTAAWTASGTVDCRIAPISGNEREIAGRIAEDAESIVTLPAETTISVRDRMVIGGGTFNVLAVRDRDEWEITRRVEVGESV